MRLAWAAFWGTLGALVIVLWVGSYSYRFDVRATVNGYVVNFQCLRGEAGVGKWVWRYRPIPLTFYVHEIEDDERLWPPMKDRPLHPSFGVRYETFNDGEMVLTAAPMWLLVTTAAAIGAAPWMLRSKQSSLCTLRVAAALSALLKFAT